MFKKYNITHVINCAFDNDSPNWFRKQFPSQYVCLNAQDALNVDIRKWYRTFEDAMDTFRTDPTSGTIYVHCQCGINRSGFLTLMYICKKFHYPIETAIHAILRQRPSALTNSSFMKQAREFLQ
jgi:protein-tyrosine phosphatase